MGQRAKITKTKLIKAIDGTGGIITAIAKKLQVTRKTLYEYLNKPKNAWAQDYLHHEREKIIDVAEKSLFEKCREQEQWATKFILATIGKKRGYVEKQEIESTGVSNISISFSDPVLNREDEETKED